MPDIIFDPEKTAEYYDDTSVAAFYEQCWGGEDIHIGLYETGSETVAEASAAVTRHLLERSGVATGQTVLDIACGYGGSLRTLASLGCRVKGIDISQNCVERARKANEEAGFGDQIEVTVGDFHNIDSAPDAWDAIICQDSIIHSPNRQKVFSEVYRILRPGGVFGFSDILTGEEADASKVEAAFARIGASADATSSDYRRMAEEAGFVLEHVEERQGDIKIHYDKLAEQLALPELELDTESVARISKSISNWQAALAGGDITWACFVARKPAQAI